MIPARIGEALAMGGAAETAADTTGAAETTGAGNETRLNEQNTCVSVTEIAWQRYGEGCQLVYEEPGSVLLLSGHTWLMLHSQCSVCVKQEQVLGWAAHSDAAMVLSVHFPVKDFHECAWPTVGVTGGLVAWTMWVVHSLTFGVNAKPGVYAGLRGKRGRRYFRDYCRFGVNTRPVVAVECCNCQRTVLWTKSVRCTGFVRYYRNTGVYEGIRRITCTHRICLRCRNNDRTITSGICCCRHNFVVDADGTHHPR